MVKAQNFRQIEKHVACSDRLTFATSSGATSKMQLHGGIVRVKTAREHLESTSKYMSAHAHTHMQVTIHILYVCDLRANV